MRTADTTPSPFQSFWSEWETCLSDMPTPSLWLGMVPLAGAPATLGEVLDAIQSLEDTDEVVHALLTLHHEGDQTAGRLVLQLMFPRISRLALTGASRGYGEDRAPEAMAAMWQAIATYPLRRTSRVVANLAMDALGHLGAQVPDHSPELPVDITGPNPLEVLEVEAAHPETTNASSEVVELLTWALHNDLVDAERIRTLALRHLGPRQTLEELAAQTGLSVSGLRFRLREGVKDIQAALAAA